MQAKEGEGGCGHSIIQLFVTKNQKRSQEMKDDNDRLTVCNRCRQRRRGRLQAIDQFDHCKKAKKKPRWPTIGQLSLTDADGGGEGGLD